MSYPLYLVISLAVTIFVAVMLAGPLSIAAMVGFWIAHYFFVTWSRKSASVEGMSDAELRRVLSDWNQGGFNQYTSSELSRVVRTGNRIEIERAVRRVLELYDEVIRRAQRRGMDPGNDRKERDELAKRFAVDAGTSVLKPHTDDRAAS